MDTKALRQKILDLAIRGKLVPQDPNDEPAEVLLERIREQKQQMLKEGKLKKKDIKNDTIIFKGEDNLHYEKFADGTVKCIEDEIPFEVPEGWEWCRLPVITTDIFAGGDKPDICEKRATEICNIPIYSNGIENDGLYGYTNKPRVTEPSITISARGTIGFCCARKTPFVPIVRLITITPSKEISLYYLKTVFEALIETGEGSSIPQLTVPGIKPKLIPIPPIMEQNRIQSKQDEILKYISDISFEKDELRRIVQQAKNKILNLAIRGKLVPQNPDDEPASVLLERIRAEKEELIKQGKIKRDKKESVIFKGDDNSYYEKIDGEVSCIDEEIPYDIPDTWTWMRLENCCVKEIRRGKSPKYAEISNVIVFAQKCNTKYNGIDISLAQYLDETTIKRYPTDEHMQDGDIVINSTGTGTLGRIGIYRNTDNTTGLLIVPDSHVTVIRSFRCISSHYLYAFMKAHQTELEKKGEGSTNQKELKPLTLKEMLIAVPPLSEQKRIDKSINVAFSHLAIIEKCLN